MVLGTTFVKKYRNMRKKALSFCVIHDTMVEKCGDGMVQKQTIQVDGSSQDIECIRENNQKLAVCFPGMGYTADKPLLYYARRCALENGYDVVCLHYGIQGYDPAQVDEAIAMACAKSLKVLRAILPAYSQVIFISKSIGTVAAGYVTQQFPACRIRNMFLTPIRDTLSYMTRACDITCSGEEDPLLDEGCLSHIQTLPIASYVFPKANHSLEIAMDVEGSVQIIQKVVALYGQWMKKD